MRQLARPLAVLLLLAALSSSSRSCTAAPPPGGRREFDVKAAAEGLGVAPAALVSASRMTRRPPAKVVQLLRNDRSSFLTGSGAVSFGCHLGAAHDPMMHEVPSMVGAASSTGTSSVRAALTLADDSYAGAIDPGDVFALHSRPRATRKIFLEFRGCHTKGADWNDYYGVKEIVTPPYDSDGLLGFSDDEARDIITIWRGVAEHFSAWEVDVTTEDPGFDGIERSDMLDEAYGIRVCVGGSSEWTRTEIGGIATLFSFGWVNKPGGPVHRDCFVFSANLIDKSRAVNLGFVWKSISHEVGHTVGLGHMGYVQDGVRQEYYRPPNGPTLWVPIMGVPGNGLYAQWSNGSYPPGMGTPTNTEDEIDVISSVLPLAASNAPGATSNSPRVLCVHVPCANATDSPGWVASTAQAVVERGTNADRYSFSADASNKPVVLSLVYRPNWQRSSRRPSDGQVLLNNWRTSMLRLALAFDQPGVNVTASPVNPWSTQQDFEARLPGPGRYSFEVRPTLQLDSTNASQVLPQLYGNVGSYMLTVLFPAKSAPPPPRNREPLAAPDAFATAFNMSLHALDVLVNDVDPDGGALVIVSHTAAAFGTAVLEDATKGLFSYVPPESASYITDSFTYTVVNGRGGAAIGLVSVAIGAKSNDSSIEPSRNATRAL